MKRKVYIDISYITLISQRGGVSYQVSRCLWKSVKILGLNSSVGWVLNGTPEALGSRPGWDLTFHHLWQLYINLIKIRRLVHSRNEYTSQSKSILIRLSYNIYINFILNFRLESDQMESFQYYFPFLHTVGWLCCHWCHTLMASTQWNYFLIYPFSINYIQYILMFITVFILHG